MHADGHGGHMKAFASIASAQSFAVKEGDTAEFLDSAPVAVARVESCEETLIKLDTLREHVRAIDAAHAEQIKKIDADYDDQCDLIETAYRAKRDPIVAVYRALRKESGY